MKKIILLLFILFFLSSCFYGNNNQNRNLNNNVNNIKENSEINSNIKEKCNKIIANNNYIGDNEEIKDLFNEYQEILNVIDKNEYNELANWKDLKCISFSGKKRTICNMLIKKDISNLKKIYSEGTFGYHFFQSIYYNKNMCNFVKDISEQKNCNEKYNALINFSNINGKGDFYELSSLGKGKAFYELGEKDYIEMAKKDFLKHCYYIK